MDNNLTSLIAAWKERIDRRQKAHYYVAKKFSNYHYAIGILATICTAVAGATLFSDVTDTGLKTAVGAIGLVAAVLSAVQTFYSHAKRGEQHRTASAQLGRVRRDIEIFEQFTPEDKREQEEKIREINQALAKVEEEAPVVSPISNADSASILTLGR